MCKMANLDSTFGKLDNAMRKAVTLSHQQLSAVCSVSNIAKVKYSKSLTVMLLSCSLGCPPVSRNHFCSAWTKTYGHVNFTTAPMSSYFSQPSTSRFLSEKIFKEVPYPLTWILVKGQCALLPKHVGIFLKGYISRYPKRVETSAIYVKNLRSVNLR